MTDCCECSLELGIAEWVAWRLFVRFVRSLICL